MVLTAEAGTPEMAFYSHICCPSGTPPGLNLQQGSLDFLHFGTRLREEAVMSDLIEAKVQSGTVSLVLLLEGVKALTPLKGTSVGAERRD